jgi:hypothetical protein
MHAMLMMSAAHLSYLEPWNEEYPKAESYHLSRASKGLRAAIELQHDDGNIEACFGTGILIYNQSWTARCGQDGETSAVHRGTDFLVPLATGLKDVLSQPDNWACIRNSELYQHCGGTVPRGVLESCSINTVFPEQLEEGFRVQYTSICGPQASDDHFQTCMKEFERLIPAIAVLKLSRCGLELSSDLESVLVRYLFTWPVLLEKEFVKLSQTSDVMANLIYYYYYSIVVAGFPEKCWWAQRRPKFTMKKLHDSLVAAGVLPTDLIGNQTA